jgi:outer membrane protein
MRRTGLMLSILLAAGGSVFAQDTNTWTLDKCLEYAYSQNITVRRSKLTNERYNLYAGQAKAQRLPSASASAGQNFSWSKNTMAGESGLSGSSGSGYSLSSGITIFNASKLTNQIKQAELEIESENFSLETTKESISLSILNAFLQVLFAEEQVKNIEKQIESSGSMALKYSDVVALRNEAIAIEEVSPEVRTNGQIIFGNQNTQTIIYGVSEEYLSIRKLKIQSGRIFNSNEIRSMLKVCIP